VAYMKSNHGAQESKLMYGIDNHMTCVTHLSLEKLYFVLLYICWNDNLQRAESGIGGILVA
jgi:hypothetical protein